jgi:FlaA1/EpsC-like NDP-sugar epimerase
MFGLDNFVNQIYFSRIKQAAYFENSMFGKFTDFKKFSTTLQALPIGLKIAIVIAADFVLLVHVLLAAYVLRVSSFELPLAQSFLRYMLGPILSLASAFSVGVYKNSLRNFHFTSDRQIILSQICVAPIWSFALLVLGLQDFYRSVVVIYVLIAIMAMILLRRAIASLLSSNEGAYLPTKESIPILIYGAGREGVALATALERHSRYKLIAFVDVDYTLVGRHVIGKHVRPMEQMWELVNRHKIREVFISNTGMTRAGRRVLVDKLLSYGLIVKTAPSVSDLLSGNVNIDALKSVNVTDLLGRDPVPPDKQLMEKAVTGRSVLVTGAGGSIGSELVRQVVNYSPRRIVMLDNNEFALFEISRRIEAQFPEHQTAPQIVSILGDVTKQQFLEVLMKEHEVDVVLHAAAYKHVHMVQKNPVSGILNNVWGTLALAEAAKSSGVGLFVLISTDKAVRPTSIMGASKRVAEMVVQALAAKSGRKPVFAIVRFGNVLGSTGSVVPLFQEQIERGGPINVTHPDVTRYFMLIPEAAQLVIQAAGMANGGEVFVLDMGEPIQIVHLARTMIEVAGLTVRNEQNPDGDISIKFIGLREGEKLFEELQIGNDVSKTVHPRIMQAQEFFLPWARLNVILKQSKSAAGQEISLSKMVMELSRMDFENDSK